MITKLALSTALAATLITSTANTAKADAGDAIAGMIIGGIVVGAIHEANNHTHCGGVHAHHDHCTRGNNRGANNHGHGHQQHYQPSAQQIANRETQIALNYFQFFVGYEDGVLGRQSRTGIAQYQAFMGFMPTGQLNAFERQILITAHLRAQYGGPEVYQIAAASPYGMRGLLNAVLEETLYPNGRPMAPQQTGYYAPQPAPYVPGGDY